jgi:hypothetical protein
MEKMLRTLPTQERISLIENRGVLAIGYIRMISPSDTDITIKVQLAGTTTDSSVTIWTPEQTPSTFKSLGNRTLEDKERRKKQIAALLLEGEIDQPKKDDWKSTIGAFDDNPLYERISEAGRKIRKSG